MDTKKDKFILKMDFPKDEKEMAKQFKLCVEFFYENTHSQVPVAYAITYLLGDNGPVHQMVNALAEKLDHPAEAVAGLAVSVIGITAVNCERKTWKKHCAPNGDATDWIRSHHYSFSFTMLCEVQDQLGLACGCALCSAVYIASNFKEKGDLCKLMEDVRAVTNSGPRDTEKCMSTQLNELADKFDWVKPLNLGCEDE